MNFSGKKEVTRTAGKLFQINSKENITGFFDCCF